MKLGQKEKIEPTRNSATKRKFLMKAFDLLCKFWNFSNLISQGQSWNILWSLLANMNWPKHHLFYDEKKQGTWLWTWPNLVQGYGPDAITLASNLKSPTFLNPQTLTNLNSKQFLVLCQHLMFAWLFNCWKVFSVSKTSSALCRISCYGCVFKC